MTKSIPWYFAPLAGGEKNYWNWPGLANFQDAALSASLREILQNSLDAKDRELRDLPVKVSLNSIDELGEGNPIQELRDTLERCLEEEIFVGTKNARSVEEITNTLKKINDLNGKIPCLCIHDSNTIGLADERFSGLVRITGANVDQSGDGVGANGFGKDATFLLSPLRTVFYYTSTTEGGEPVEKFMGKSRLGTHRSHEGIQVQQTGYYGLPTPADSNGDCIREFRNDEIPDWAKRLRPRELGKGTTLIIPCPILVDEAEDSHYPEAAIVTLSNYYLAIKKGDLELCLGDDIELKKSNLEDKYEEYKDLFLRGEEVDLLNQDKIKTCFKATDAVHSCDDSGEWTIPDFGPIDWYLKTSDQGERRVGLIRRGMMIGQHQEGLKVFSGAKYFYLTVNILGADASETFRLIENGDHTEIVLKRLDSFSPEAKEKHRKRYKTFVDKIKSFIEENLKEKAEQQWSHDLLSSFFPGDSSDEGSARNENGATEDSLSLTLLQPKKKGEADYKGGGDGPGSNKRGRGRKRKKRVMTIPGPVPGLIKAKKFRAIETEAFNDQLSYISLNFDSPPNPGRYELKLVNVNLEGSTSQIDFFDQNGDESSKEIGIDESNSRNRVVAIVNKKCFESALDLHLVAMGDEQ